jgi:uroporphyrinogen decarboxylase
MTVASTLDSRTRVRVALDHREPDRVPRDLGGTRYSGIHARLYPAVRTAFDLPPVEPFVFDVIQQLARIDGDLLDRVGADVRDIEPRPPSTWQRVIREEGDYRTFRDEWGVRWSMPRDDGLYFDTTGSPLAGEIDETHVRAFDWPDPANPARFEGMGETARRIVADERRAVFVGSICAGLTEVYFRLRGYEEGYMDLVRRPSLARRIMEGILEVKLGYWERALAALGESVDIVGEADDLGGQQNLLFSPATYRSIVKPLHAELFRFLHARTQAKVFLHSCGAIRPLIPDLIEIGVEVLDPIQVSAAGMDAAGLKRDFGRDLVLWGGAVDSQHVLDRASPAEIAAEARRHIAELAPGGGYVYASIHNIQPNVPPVNVVALWTAIEDAGGYAVREPDGGGSGEEIR